VVLVSGPGIVLEGLDASGEDDVGEVEVLGVPAWASAGAVMPLLAVAQQEHDAPFPGGVLLAELIQVGDLEGELVRNAELLGVDRKDELVAQVRKCFLQYKVRPKSGVALKQETNTSK
jgi:hypothetical protein